MPVRDEKRAVVAEIKDRLTTAQAVFVADYKGIPVAQFTELRRRLRASDSLLKVTKNTLTIIAAKEAGLDNLAAYLEGPVALAFSFRDPAATAKVLVEFTREHKLLDVKGGVVSGRSLSAEQVKVLADLPPFEAMMAKVVGQIKSPLYALVNVLSGPMRSLVYVLDAIRTKQAEAS
ncbi:MAG TPA: 50S ribosomal protein L10 [Desulfotomaculum sp.]|nr:50S ribosomal protein L10 [Desulfotomaculum sp.]